MIKNRKVRSIHAPKFDDTKNPSVISGFLILIIP